MTYLFNFIADLDVPLFNSGFFGALTQIWQLNVDVREVAAHKHLQIQAIDRLVRVICGDLKMRFYQYQFVCRALASRSVKA